MLVLDAVFHLSLNVFASLAVAGGVGLILGLWAYYGTRDSRFLYRGRSRHTFYCIKCGRVYTHRRGDRPQPCPDCGFKNDRLKF